jgi:predicted nuclease of predicted toxin-antitoxin system
VKIVADENLESQIVHRLRLLGHEVLYVAEMDSGIDDDTVLERSRHSNAILLTSDKDFGELVFRQRLLHSGVVLVRLAGHTPDRKADIVAFVFESHGHELPGKFTVVGDRTLRIREPQVL